MAVEPGFTNKVLLDLYMSFPVCLDLFTAAETRLLER